MVLGEPIVEPEVDLTAFLEKQRQVSEIDAPILLSKEEEDDDEIDHSLAHLSIGGPATSSKKGKVRQVEWDPALERMKQEKEDAEANRGNADDTHHHGPAIDGSTTPFRSEIQIPC